MLRRGPGLVRVAATTAVVAGTAGAVQHRQQIDRVSCQPPVRLRPVFLLAKMQ